MRRYISSDQEYKYIKDDKSFFEIWTSKESLTKCIGDGLNKIIKDIPGLPLNGKKEYLGKNYISECIEYNGYIISVTLEKDDLKEFKILVGDTYI